MYHLLEQLLFGPNPIHAVGFVGPLPIEVVLGFAHLRFVLVAHHPIRRVVEAGPLQLVQLRGVLVQERLVQLWDVGLREGPSFPLVAPQLPLLEPVGDQGA